MKQPRGKKKVAAKKKAYGPQRPPKSGSDPHGPSSPKRKRAKAAKKRVPYKHK